MKKILFCLLTPALVILFTGASVWEGAAAVSGDFPDAGLYVATNSFPRNTVVDLTNLETGKTVRVIVTAGLESPGLLALVSREAAAAVGLQSRTIGRIRMIQPSDPVAFSRFTEDYFRSGDPDYDPRAAVEEAGRVPGVTAAPGTPPSGKEPDKPAAQEHSAASREREKDPESAWIASSPAVPPADTGGTDPYGPVYEMLPYPPVSSLPAQPPVSVPETIPPPAAVPEAPPPPVSIPAAPQDVPAAGADPGYVYMLIPAEERPPISWDTSPIPPPVKPDPKPEPPPKPVQREPERIILIPGAVPGTFSVPSVVELETGKYYLQIGAYGRVELVEKELARIEKTYPLAVQCTKSNEKPVYRILIGPVNQGESGALLRSFKIKGYDDAFVRRGE
ncbi:MAG: SPOR domain-containing protein [Treponema sp.]|nr:SPOR domain-containing protein [Treponema sp.]